MNSRTNNAGGYWPLHTRAPYDPEDDVSHGIHVSFISLGPGTTLVDYSHPSDYVLLGLDDPIDPFGSGAYVPPFASPRAKSGDIEDGKSCVVCLDDFEPREMVTLTPCNHMFHENCIVPWVKSHGQCPVCRFVISEHNKESEGRQTVNNRELGNDPFARDLVSFIRDMETRG
ncbi:hypothetical protein L1987_37805 [Smallanthus sonchifolius]|uniref:Uncharacterized protein n=1 Tax=Smallanthus sonchifolius TaxID=185202 RepID=A0ACB9HI30_9ASTR|nr:hypothetical protein L1987_37805 [Smallanthus sonchifolius]